MDCWAGKPDAGEAEPGKPEAGDAVVWVVWRVAGKGERAGECWTEDVKCVADGVGLSGGKAAVAKGSWWCTDAGVSTNMMDGPGASSWATAVRGTGLEENFGRDSGSRIAGALDEDEICDVES